MTCSSLSIGVLSGLLRWTCPTTESLASARHWLPMLSGHWFKGGAGNEPVVGFYEAIADAIEPCMDVCKLIIA